MFKNRLVAIRFVLLFWMSAAACSARNSSEDSVQADGSAVAERTPVHATSSPADPDSLLRATFGLTTDLRRSRTAVIDRLGPPGRVLRNPIQNIHVTGRIDTLVSLRYETLSATYWVPGEPGERDIPVDIAILPPWPVAVDVPESAGRGELVRRWGEPAFATSAADTVILNWNVWADDAEEYLQAYLVGNEIQKLRWSFYID